MWTFHSYKVRALLFLPHSVSHRGTQEAAQAKPFNVWSHSAAPHTSTPALGLPPQCPLAAARLVLLPCRLIIRNGDNIEAPPVYDSYEVEYLPIEGLISTSRSFFIELTTDSGGVAAGIALRYEGKWLTGKAAATMPSLPLPGVGDCLT